MRVSRKLLFFFIILTEIQNARGIMDVLAEMLSAIDPGNKEGLRQEVIVDLVGQCRTYKQRVVHLVNSLRLALNDDLQRLLAKHEAIASGNPVQPDKPKAGPSGALVDVGGPLVDTGNDKKQLDGRSTSSAGAGSNPLNQLLLTAPPATNGPTPTTKVDPKMDLLRADSLALVPVSGQQPTTPVSQQNALALMDMFGSDNAPNSVNVASQINPSPPQFQQQQNFQASQGGFYSNGSAQTWGPLSMNSHSTHKVLVLPGMVRLCSRSSHFTGYGSPTSGSLPPPPWEAQSTDDGIPVAGPRYPQPPVQVTTKVVVTHGQGGFNPQGPQLTGSDRLVQAVIWVCRSTSPRAIYGYDSAGYSSGQMTSMYPQQIDDNSMKNSYQVSAPSYVTPSKPSRPEDKLFGDLVDFAKLKPTKPTSGAAGSV
ncbi:target of Myb protein 1 [Prunus yedoensis var. nudiflora]|uniref:Target of Myb protein 1 n=1 Tax=Prunus yedoensis var. nudiflora TaxID=2094558 RepID=A0A314UP63_PRUYE|nr:target of Myb protein 1 [Prunus yedoensis var. nudiflora]